METGLGESFLMKTVEVTVCDQVIKAPLLFRNGVCQVPGSRESQLAWHEGPQAYPMDWSVQEAWNWSLWPVVGRDLRPPDPQKTTQVLSGVGPPTLIKVSSNHRPSHIFTAISWKTELDSPNYTAHEFLWPTKTKFWGVICYNATDSKYVIYLLSTDSSTFLCLNRQPPGQTIITTKAVVSPHLLSPHSLLPPPSNPLTF